MHRFQSWLCRSRSKRWVWDILGWLGALILALVMGIFAPAQTVSAQTVSAQTVSNYTLSQAADFNRLEHYPIQLLPSTANYRPVSDWLGRLILPTQAEYAADAGDWAWLEIWHSPNPDLLGKTVKLTWQASPALDTYLDKVTRDVQFTEKAENFGAKGNVVPTRLNGRQAVGPLQSLAGARPQDDVTVKLMGSPKLVTGEIPTVTVSQEPVQVTGREYGLVKLLEPDTRLNKPVPEVCPGDLPCPTEYFRAQHFDSARGDFSGTIETIRIPQQPMLKGDRFFSNIRDLVDSPAGSEGWYVYGAVDRENVFTVQALKSRALFRVQPDEVILGQKAGRNYLDRGNWQDSSARKGTLQRVLLSPTNPSSEAAVAAWQAGDYALVMHLFGGIGGENKELTPLGTVTGHFSFGLARVVQEPITQELQFNVHYQQIYAHNAGGIVSGTQDWTAYAGDLQRGWIAQRPFSDILVKLDYFIGDLQLGETRLSLFEALLIQSQVIEARYRTGDGTGVATVTPATSCVQDSSQALYIAIAQIRHQAETDPNLVQWIADHPNDPDVQKIDRFAALGEDLTQALSPYGVVRSDWQNNAETLAGVNARGNQLANRSGLVAGILSWRSMMPRWGQDDLALIFLKNGADLWFLRTNQLGGFDPSIEPIPPTALFGLIPGLSRVALRLARSFAIPLSAPLLGVTLLALVLIAIGLLPFGLKSGYLQWQIVRTPPLRGLLNGAKLFFFPALIEESIFRVMLLPHPTEGVTPTTWLAWAVLGIGLFVVYHWGLSQVRPEAGQALRDRRFLLMVVWFGLILTLLYSLTGSLWAVTIVHWLVVLGWIYRLGGYQRLQGQGLT